MSEVCKECKSYAAEYDGLCGNCLLKSGRLAAEIDPWLAAKQRLRNLEEAKGIYNKDEVELDRIELRTRPKPAERDGMQKVDQNDSGPGK